MERKLSDELIPREIGVVPFGKTRVDMETSDQLSREVNDALFHIASCIRRLNVEEVVELSSGLGLAGMEGLETLLNWAREKMGDDKIDLPKDKPAGRRA
jgi:hypothetical protein